LFSKPTGSPPVGFFLPKDSCLCLVFFEKNYVTIQRYVFEGEAEELDLLVQLAHRLNVVVRPEWEEEPLESLKAGLRELNKVRSGKKWPGSLLNCLTNSKINC
jgi:hypothetical protein